jgi:membrane-associated protein
VHAVATLLASLSDAIGELDGVEELMAYVVVMVMVAAEAIFPILPGETTVVTAANFASQGDLGIFWVFVAGWLGAMGGDLIGFGAGRLGR